MSRLADSVGAVAKIAPTMRADQIILANLCGRGGKTLFTVAGARGTAL